MQQFSPQQLVDHINTSTDKPVLIDVREPHELGICAIDGARNIPLNQLPGALNELDPEQEYALICHHGMRSQRACDFLYANGFSKLINLAGGIEAWACDIDPQMARY